LVITHVFDIILWVYLVSIYLGFTYMYYMVIILHNSLCLVSYFFNCTCIMLHISVFNWLPNNSMIIYYNIFRIYTCTIWLYRHMSYCKCTCMLHSSVFNSLYINMFMVYTCTTWLYKHICDILWYFVIFCNILIFIIYILQGYTSIYVNNSLSNNTYV